MSIAAVVRIGSCMNIRTYSVICPVCRQRTEEFSEAAALDWYWGHYLAEPVKAA